MIRYTIVAIVGGLLAVMGQSGLSEETPGQGAAELKALQVERVDLLAKVVERYVIQAGAGGASIQDVVSAKIELLSAKLDMAETRQQRIAILEERVEVLRTLVDYADLQLKGGFGANVAAEFYRAKARFLTAKIELARISHHTGQIDDSVSGGQTFLSVPEFLENRTDRNVCPPVVRNAD